ncbi:hypothetical protein NVI2019_NGLDDFDA_01194 [Providencia alcalifaciens]|nr:hypothetical protein NVI2019_NGLDDFDA_01194 [Providencia alcalifaciens]CAG9415950.1 hypothetical protein NVI2019_OGMBKCAO_01197 [Providencia alcalifaciens]
MICHHVTNAHIDLHSVIAKPLKAVALRGVLYLPIKTLCLIKHPHQSAMVGYQPQRLRDNSSQLRALS